MFRNMVTSLFKHERIRTTNAKAKELRRWADSLITLAKRGDLHARRQALSIIREKDVVHKLFEEAPKRFGAVSGGYTRIVKLGRRPGDAAPISLIELITPEPPKKKKTKKKKKAAPAVDKQVTAEETATEAEKTKAEPEDKAEASAGEEETDATEAEPEETAELEAVSEDTGPESADQDAAPPEAAEPEPEEPAAATEEPEKPTEAAPAEAEEPQEAKAAEPETPEEKPEDTDAKK